MKFRRPSRNPKPSTDSGPAALRLVQIEKPVYGGAFLARDEGRAVFVPLALPGEEVQVRLVEQKRGYAEAEIETLVKPAMERLAPGCRHFGPCGGCQYQHTDYENQLRFKEAILRETLARGGVTPPEEIAILAGKPWAYRNRIRVAIDAEGNPGYRARRSHALVGIAECPIAAPLLVRGALAAAGPIRRMPPQMRPHELALFCDAEETQLLVTMFTRSPQMGNNKAAFDELERSLRQSLPELSGMELVVEGHAGQPARALAQAGHSSLTYRAAGCDYRVDHGAFFQVNRWLVDALVERVTSASGGTLAWDLFAGVGLFARRLAASFEQVVAVESAPAAMDALHANLELTAGRAVEASSLEFVRGHGKAQRPDLVVVDPPRTGLGSEMTTRLATIATPAMVYVSCDPATLTRDLRVLLDAGYVVEDVTLIDLFPQTFHLETVVRLRRA